MSVGGKNQMRQAVTLKSALLLVALLVGASACGSTTASRVGACLQQNQPPPSSSMPARMRNTGRRFARQFCELAEQHGLLSPSGDLSSANAETLLRSHPEPFERVCSVAFEIGLTRSPPAFSRALRARINPAHYAARLCQYMVESGGFDQNGIKPSATGEVFDNHPAFGAPFLEASLVAGWQPTLGISRQDWAFVARALSLELLQRRLFYTTGPTPSDYHVREPGTSNTLREIVARLRANGTIS
jgi:hypothetical protein